MISQVQIILIHFWSQWAFRLSIIFQCPTSCRGNKNGRKDASNADFTRLQRLFWFFKSIDFPCCSRWGTIIFEFIHFGYNHCVHCLPHDQSFEWVHYNKFKSYEKYCRHLSNVLARGLKHSVQHLVAFKLAKLRLDCRRQLLFLLLNQFSTISNWSSQTI